jgi:hypothetical protein
MPEHFAMRAVQLHFGLGREEIGFELDGKPHMKKMQQGKCLHYSLWSDNIWHPEMEGLLPTQEDYKTKGVVKGYPLRLFCPSQDYICRLVHSKYMFARKFMGGALAEQLGCETKLPAAMAACLGEFNATR